MDDDIHFNTIYRYKSHIVTQATWVLTKVVVSPDGAFRWIGDEGGDNWSVVHLFPQAYADVHMAEAGPKLFGSKCPKPVMIRPKAPDVVNETPNAPDNDETVMVPKSPAGAPQEGYIFCVPLPPKPKKGGKRKANPRRNKRQHEGGRSQDDFADDAVYDAVDQAQDAIQEHNKENAKQQYQWFATKDSEQMEKLIQYLSYCMQKEGLWRVLRDDMVTLRPDEYAQVYPIQSPPVVAQKPPKAKKPRKGNNGEGNTGIVSNRPLYGHLWDQLKYGQYDPPNLDEPPFDPIPEPVPEIEIDDPGPYEAHEDIWHYDPTMDYERPRTPPRPVELEVQREAPPIEEWGSEPDLATIANELVDHDDEFARHQNKKEEIAYRLDYVSQQLLRRQLENKKLFEEHGSGLKGIAEAVLKRRATDVPVRTPVTLPRRTSHQPRLHGIAEEWPIERRVEPDSIIKQLEKGRSERNPPGVPKRETSRQESRSKPRRISKQPDNSEDVMFESQPVAMLLPYTDPEFGKPSVDACIVPVIGHRDNRRRGSQPNYELPNSVTEHHHRQRSQVDYDMPNPHTGNQQRHSSHHGHDDFDASARHRHQHREEKRYAPDDKYNNREVRTTHSTSYIGNGHETANQFNDHSYRGIERQPPSYDKYMERETSINHHAETNGRNPFVDAQASERRHQRHHQHPKDDFPDYARELMGKADDRIAKLRAEQHAPTTETHHSRYSHPMETNHGHGSKGKDLYDRKREDVNHSLNHNNTFDNPAAQIEERRQRRGVRSASSPHDVNKAEIRNYFDAPRIEEHIEEEVKHTVSHNPFSRDTDGVILRGASDTGKHMLNGGIRKGQSVFDEFEDDVAAQVF